MLIADGAPAVVLSARTAAFLERYAALTSVRVRVRGIDPAISAELEELRQAAMAWRGTATGTVVAHQAEPGADSGWLSTLEAGRLLGITARGIRKAITTGRLPATTVAGRRRVSREDLAHYDAARRAA